MKNTQTAGRRGSRLRKRVRQHEDEHEGFLALDGGRSHRC